MLCLSHNVSEAAKYGGERAVGPPPSQGDHSLAVQILQHEWQRFKEEHKSKASHGFPLSYR